MGQAMMKTVEFSIVGQERIARLKPCLRAAGISCRVDRSNGQGPRLTISMKEGDDLRLLALWDELTQLRVLYLEERQRQRVEQLSFLEGSEEAVVL